MANKDWKKWGRQGDFFCCFSLFELHCIAAIKTEGLIMTFHLHLWVLQRVIYSDCILFSGHLCSATVENGSKILALPTTPLVRGGVRYCFSQRGRSLQNKSLNNKSVSSSSSSSSPLNPTKERQYLSFRALC